MPYEFELVGREAELDRIEPSWQVATRCPAASRSRDRREPARPRCGARPSTRASLSGYLALTARPAGAEVQLSLAGLSDLLEPHLETVLPVLPGPQRRALEVALLLRDDGGNAPSQRAIAAGTLNAIRQPRPGEPRADRDRRRPMARRALDRGHHLRAAAAPGRAELRSWRRGARSRSPVVATASTGPQTGPWISRWIARRSGSRSGRSASARCIDSCAPGPASCSTDGRSSEFTRPRLGTRFTRSSSRGRSNGPVRCSTVGRAGRAAEMPRPPQSRWS